MSTTTPGRRITYIQTAIQHSSKIYEFFGFTPGHTPPLSRLFIADDPGPQDLPSRDEGAANGYAAPNAHTGPGGATNGIRQVNGAPNGAPNGHIKPPPLVIKKKASRHRTFCRALIQDFGPIWSAFRPCPRSPLTPPQVHLLHGHGNARPPRPAAAQPLPSRVP